MPATGYLQVRAYSSYAQIPLKDVAITVTDENNDVIAMRLTNSSGLLNSPLEILVPNLSESLTPGATARPYKTVNIYARLEDYELIEVERTQVFADTVTVQNLELIPLAEFPESRNESEIFDTTPQAL